MPQTARADHPPAEALLVDHETLEAELLTGEDAPAVLAYHAPIRERARTFADAASLAARIADEVEAIHQAMDALDATYSERKTPVLTSREALQADLNELQARIDGLTAELALLDETGEAAKANHRWGRGWRLNRLDEYRQDFGRDLKLPKADRSLPFPAGTLTFYQNPSHLEWIREQVDLQTDEEGKTDTGAILEAVAVLNRLGLYGLHQQFVEMTPKLRLTELKKALTVEGGDCYFEVIVAAAEMTEEIAAAVNAGTVQVKPGAVDTTTGDIRNWLVRIPAVYERRSESGEITLRSPILRRVEPAEPYEIGWKRADPSSAKGGATDGDA